MTKSKTKKTNRYVAYYFLTAAARKGPDTIPLKVARVAAVNKVDAFLKASTPARVVYDIETENAAMRRKKPLKSLPRDEYGLYLPLPLPETIQKEQEDALHEELMLQWNPNDYVFIYSTSTGDISMLTPEVNEGPAASETPTEPAPAAVETATPEPAPVAPVPEAPPAPAEPLEYEPGEYEDDYDDDDSYEVEDDEEPEMPVDHYKIPPPARVDLTEYVGDVDEGTVELPEIVETEGLSMNQLAIVFIVLLVALFSLLVGYTIGTSHATAAVHAIPPHG